MEGKACYPCSGPPHPTATSHSSLPFQEGVRAQGRWCSGMENTSLSGGTEGGRGRQEGAAAS